MVDVSIIIVNWNTKEYLTKCIDSIEGDKGNYSKEIIVVDNASTDGSVQIIKDRYPKAKLIKNSENLGFSKANNISIDDYVDIKYVSSKWIRN